MRKTYASRRSRGIKTRDAGILGIWLGIRDYIFGEYGRFWMGKDMGNLYWEILVKYNL